MQYNKLWKITSYKDYVDNWPLGSRINKITTYLKKLGYSSGEEFFNKNAYLAQSLANQKVGGIIDRIFDTTELPENTQHYLIQFTYLAIDFLIENDIQIGESIRTNQVSLNNGRTDSSSNSISSVDQLVGTMAWRAFTMSAIQTLYKSYCKNEGIPFLLDPTLFYSKEKIDEMIAEQDKYLLDMKDLIKKEIIKDILLQDEISKKAADILKNDKQFKEEIKGEQGEGLNTKIKIKPGKNLVVRESLQEQIHKLDNTKADKSEIPNTSDFVTKKMLDSELSYAKRYVDRADIELQKNIDNKQDKGNYVTEQSLSESLKTKIDKTTIIKTKGE